MTAGFLAFLAVAYTFLLRGCLHCPMTTTSYVMTLACQDPLSVLTGVSDLVHMVRCPHWTHGTQLVLVWATVHRGTELLWCPKNLFF